MIMKKSLFSALMIVVSTIVTMAQSQTFQLKGTILDGEQNAVSYATVLLSPNGEMFSPDGENHHFTTSDKNGTFLFRAVAGNYTLAISSIGYEGYKAEVSLTADSNLGEIILTESAEVIEDVVVMGNLIKREADRFVMNNISESALAKGRDTYELLKLAPAVYADNNGTISINGKAGAKVIINEREVRMTSDQLMAYLKAIPAENLQKIEIIPESGADYDADSANGIIKITLRRQRESGTSGSVALGGLLSTIAPAHTIGPNGNINHKNGKWNLYGNFSFQLTDADTGNLLMQENTHYDNGAHLSSTTNTQQRNQQEGGMVGMVYELSESSSIGVEYNIWHRPSMPNTTGSTLGYTLGDYEEVHESLYTQQSGTLNQSATANYIRSLDDQGSTLKIIADWANNRTDGKNDNSNKLRTALGGVECTTTDSLYRNHSSANYSFYTLTAAVEKRLSALTTISFGAKYSLTDALSTTDYSYKSGEEWKDLPSYSSTTDYNEHIAALYGIYSTRFLSGTSLSAGLRAEYTAIPQLKESYLSLFPHLNASVPLNPTQTVILSAAYKRAVSRPSFWAMNPVRQQLSEYSYQVGNPDLKPVFANNFSLTGIFFYRYSLTIGASLQDNIISQLAMIDEADPTGRTLKYIHKNLNNVYQYYIQLAIPAQISPWWNINGNLLGVMLDQKIAATDSNDRTFTAQGYLLNNFTLPKAWSVDFTWQFMTDAKIGNLQQEGTGNISLSLNKRLLEDKLSLSLSLNNILNTSDQVVHSSGEGFHKTLYSPSLWKRSINLSIRYNFQSGKMFRAKSVESGAADEKSRIGN